MTRLRTFFVLVSLAATLTLASSLVPGKASATQIGAFFGVDSIIPAALATNYFFWFTFLLASAGMIKIRRLRRPDT
jgi:low temperature requirement protein LtrA